MKKKEKLEKFRLVMENKESKLISVYSRSKWGEGEKEGGEYMKEKLNKKKRGET